MASLSLASGLQPHIRYDQGSHTYQVMLPNGGWNTLVTNEENLPDWGRSMELATPGQLYLHLNSERTLDQPDPYSYSSIGSYFYGQSQEDGLPETRGWLAVGIPTSPSALPVTGVASYSGLIRGSADILLPDGWGGTMPEVITGTTSLTFNFGASTLAGAMSPKLGSVDLGTFNFVNTVYSTGEYSGRFDTSVTGMNSFSGSLVGPNGEELIGSWALPFLLPADGSRHQAAGAWIAKQGN